jgi:hypothetical protein
MFVLLKVVYIWMEMKYSFDVHFKFEQSNHFDLLPPFARISFDLMFFPRAEFRANLEFSHAEAGKQQQRRRCQQS